MRLLLGFGNRARHGKDSAAQAIANYFDSKFPAYPQVRIFKFAAALYDVCRKEYGMTEKDAPLLQRVGAEKRAQNDRYWIDRLFFDISTFNGVGIITDVRYKNEAQEIKKRGGYLINVTRLEEDGTPFVASDRPANHPSETELDGYNWDAFIKTKSGEEGLAAEQAITLGHYFYEISKPENV